MNLPRSQKILNVTHRVPYPPDKGDRIRTFNMLRHLAQRHQVYLACFADEEVSELTRRELEALCEQVAIIPLQSKWRKPRMAMSLLTGGTASIAAFQSALMTRMLRSWIREIDFNLALASASSVAPYLQLEAKANGIPVLVDLVDVDSEKWLNYASTSSIPMRWVYQREGVALRRYEREISSWADAVLLVSEAETQLFQTIAPVARAHAISNGVDLEYFQPSSASVKQGSCVFVGALDYHPNVDAVCWFAKTIWQDIRSNHPEARFQIVGRRPVAAVMKLKEIAGIEVVGQVPDVRPYVHSSQVVVAPLRIARGLQNKVLEAMAMGKPVVSSSAALAGLDPSVKAPAVQVNSDLDWIRELIRLFSSQQMCDELGRCGRVYVEAHYHWNRCLEPLEQLIQSLHCTKTSKKCTSIGQTVTV